MRFVHKYKKPYLYLSESISIDDKLYGSELNLSFTGGGGHSECCSCGVGSAGPPGEYVIL